jgi:glycosyltransferase involved in cell wall biosynthesis
MRSLYISHNGMAEPLGQAQVLPYLTGLARRGVEVEILSFERADTSPAAINALATRLRAEQIAWQPLVRSVTSHTLWRKAWESSIGVMEALKLALRRRPHIVHARSYLPAAVADTVVRAVPRANLLFDCRGMLGDEYVDNGHWHAKGLKYRLVKQYERRLFRRADGMVVLTEALKRWLTSRALLGPDVRLAVVPCCVDTLRFRPDPETRAKQRAALGLGERLVVVYAGSLGSWYLEREMARFVAHVTRLRKDAVFLVLSRADATALRAAAQQEGLAQEAVIVRSVAPTEMPAALAAGDIGLSFIQSCFSKMGSSPTKVAEYLSVGMPIVANGDIGDQGDLTVEREACVILQGFDDDSIRHAARTAVSLAERPYLTRAAATHAVAERRFSLAAIGVPRYAELYREICSR